MADSTTDRVEIQASEVARGCQNRKRRLVRRFLFSSALLVLTALIAANFCYIPPRQLTILGSDRQPATEALVAYRYVGYRFNLVDSTLWFRPGALVRADRQERIELPALLTRKPGFLDAWPQHQLELVYDPRSHVAIRVGRLKESRPGDYELNADGTEIVLVDRTNDPEKWEQTLEMLSAALLDPSWGGPERRGEAERRIATTRADREFLLSALRRELEGLLARHGAGADAQGRPWRERLARWPKRLEELESWLGRSAVAK
jgi:hypothetical protein